MHEVAGVIHYRVCNMPAQTPPTSTTALASAPPPYINTLADEDVEKALQTSEIRYALTCKGGVLTKELTAKTLVLYSN